MAAAKNETEAGAVAGLPRQENLFGSGDNVSLLLMLRVQVTAAGHGRTCEQKETKMKFEPFFLEFSGKKIPSSRKPRLNFEMNTENIKMKKKRSVRIPNFKSVLASGIVFTESCSQDKLLSESNFSPLESGSFIFEKKLNFL